MDEKLNQVRLNLASKKLREMREKRILTDVILKCRGGTIHAHRCVLMATNTFFYNIFSDNLNGDAGIQIEFEHCNVDVMVIVISTLYGDVPQTFKSLDQIINVLETSHLIEEMMLFNYCLNLLLQLLTADNCIDIWTLTVKYSQKKAETSVMKYMVDHLQQLLGNGKMADMTVDQMTDFVQFASEAPTVGDQLISVVMQWGKKNQIQRLDKVIALFNLLEKLVFSTDRVRGFNQEYLINNSPELMAYLTSAKEVATNVGSGFDSEGRLTTSVAILEATPGTDEVLPSPQPPQPAPRGFRGSKAFSGGPKCRTASTISSNCSHRLSSNVSKSTRIGGRKPKVPIRTVRGSSSSYDRSLSEKITIPIVRSSTPSSFTNSKATTTCPKSPNLSPKCTNRSKSPKTSPARPKTPTGQPKNRPKTPTGIPISTNQSENEEKPKTNVGNAKIPKTKPKIPNPTPNCPQPTSDRIVCQLPCPTIPKTPPRPKTPTIPIRPKSSCKCSKMSMTHPKTSPNDEHVPRLLQVVPAASKVRCVPTTNSIVPPSPSISARSGRLSSSTISIPSIRASSSNTSADHTFVMYFDPKNPNLNSTNELAEIIPDPMQIPTIFQTTASSTANLCAFSASRLNGITRSNSTSTTTFITTRPSISSFPQIQSVKDDVKESISTNSDDSIVEAKLEVEVPKKELFIHFYSVRNSELFSQTYSTAKKQWASCKSVALSESVSSNWYPLNSMYGEPFYFAISNDKKFVGYSAITNQTYDGPAVKFQSRVAGVVDGPLIYVWNYESIAQFDSESYTWKSLAPNPHVFAGWSNLLASSNQLYFHATFPPAIYKYDFEKNEWELKKAFKETSNTKSIKCKCLQNCCKKKLYFIANERQLLTFDTEANAWNGKFLPEFESRVPLFMNCDESFIIFADKQIKNQYFLYYPECNKLDFFQNNDILYNESFVTCDVTI